MNKIIIIGCLLLANVLNFYAADQHRRMIKCGSNSKIESCCLTISPYRTLMATWIKEGGNYVAIQQVTLPDPHDRDSNVVMVTPLSNAKMIFHQLQARSFQRKRLTDSWEYLKFFTGL